LLRIGPFSQLARVTIKTLRFYDGVGLFRPARVDPQTGYRLYSPGQLPALRRIRLLRELGCSIAEIQVLTSTSPQSIENRLQAAGLRRRLMVAVALAEQRLRQLDALVGPTEAVAHSSLPLIERQIAPTPAFTLRDSVSSAGGDIHGMFEVAEQQVALLGRRAPCSPFMLLHNMDYHRPRIDVEVCIPVQTEALGSAGVRLVEPIARAACVEFTGEYSQAPALFDAALESLEGTGACLAGPIREVYLRFGADQRGYTLDPQCLANDVRQYRTELQIPLR
jgi:DNA-binding transcriptional MerR regulator/effector-binding domain-containing protein